MKKVVLAFLFLALLALAACAPRHIHTHTPIAVEAVTPTCTAEGKTAGHICADCGEILDGCETVAANGHTPVAVAAVKATCTKAGCSEGEICDVCEEVLSSCETIPATGHDWECIEVLESGKEGRFWCEDCGKVLCKPLTAKNLGIPVLKLEGSLDGVSKTVKVRVAASYDDGEGGSFSCDAQLRVQGGSSSGLPKKNFNIWLLASGTDDKYKVELAEGWGRESKYCLKANYIDVSQSRNVVSAKIWGDIVRARHDAGELADLVNGGAVDGFPVLVFLNGEVYGLYTFNMPKDNWVFGLKKGKGHTAMLFGADWTQSVMLRERTHHNVAASGWSLEFCSTEETEEGTDWVADSFNNLIAFVNNNDGTAFKNGISQYVDLDAAIDTMIYVQLISAEDNTGKNILWVTYDGVKWIPSMYDMDDSWGLIWHGGGYYSTEISGDHFVSNALWIKLKANFQTKIYARYAELRNEFLTPAYVEAKFADFIGQIDSGLYKMDAALWPDMPSIKTNNYAKVCEWVEARFAYMDGYMKFE